MSRSFFLASFLIAACSSTAQVRGGSAPSIKDFALSPTDLRVGESAKLDGTMTIDDADGDIAVASGTLTLPDGTTRPIQDVVLQAGERKTVPVLYSIPALPVQQPGEYRVSVQARDHEGNPSAAAVVTLTAR